MFTDGSAGVALPVDTDLKYQLIADIDAFLFEVDACTKLMHKLFQRLRAHASSPIPDNKVTAALRDSLRKFGVGEGWFRILDRNRNFFIHEGTPYLAIDISNDAAWDLLIMKENLSKFDQPKKFFRFSELQDIANGFACAKDALQKYLMGLFK